MIHNIVLSFPNINLQNILKFQETRGDAIVYNFIVDGLDLTNCQIRGEIYDLNTSVKMANALGGALSAPEIVVTDAVNGKFTATCHTGLTATFQPFGQVEFTITDGSGNKWTILQQPIAFTFERIIWSDETQNRVADTGQDPLF